MRLLGIRRFRRRRRIKLRLRNIVFLFSWLWVLAVMPNELKIIGLIGWPIIWKLAPLALKKAIYPQGENPGHVYVIQDKETELYKIGRTTNLERRLRELGVGRTARLISSKRVGDCHAVEKSAHKRYRRNRLPQTEYFKLPRPPEI